MIIAAQLIYLFILKKDAIEYLYLDKEHNFCEINFKRDDDGFFLFCFFMTCAVGFFWYRNLHPLVQIQVLQKTLVFAWYYNVLCLHGVPGLW